MKHFVVLLMMMNDFDVHLYYFDLIIEILMVFHLIMIDLNHQIFLVVFEVDQDQKKHVDHVNHLIHHQDFFLHVIFEHH